MTSALPRLIGAVALGGALGSVLRDAAGSWVPDGDGMPWTTLAINVSGALLLALLPALAAVRRSPVLAAGLGPGLLGGWTTLSATSEQGRSLVADGRAGLALTYLLLTLVTAVGAVALASYVVGREPR